MCQWDRLPEGFSFDKREFLKKWSLLNQCEGSCSPVFSFISWKSKKYLRLPRLAIRFTVVKLKTVNLNESFASDWLRELYEFSELITERSRPMQSQMTFDSHWKISPGSHWYWLQSNFQVNVKKLNKDYFRSAFLRFTIGLEILPAAFSCAWFCFCAFASSSHWFVLMLTLVLVDSGFCFTTLNQNHFTRKLPCFVCVKIWAKRVVV